MAFFLSLEGIHRRDLDTGAKDTGAKLFAALGQPVLVHGARPSRDQIQQAGRGMILPACQVYDAGELTGAPSASVLVMPHASHQPPAPEPPTKTGRVIRCGSQTRLDTGPHGIPRSCQLSSQASDGSSFEAQLSDRPADRPHTQTRPRGHTPAHHVPGISPSGRWFRGISSVA